MKLSFSSLSFHQQTTYGVDVTPGVGLGQEPSLEPSASGHVTTGPPKLKVDGFGVEFDHELKLLAELQSAVAIGGVAPHIDAGPGGVTASLAIPVPDVSCGVFSLSNVSFHSSVEVPFDKRPVVVGIGFASRDKPFSLSVLSFAGGGYIDVLIDAHGPAIEASLEFGAQISVDFVVAKGEVHAFGGVQYLQDSSGHVAIAGYLRIGGSIEVLALVSVSIELRIALTYDSDTTRLVGRATLVLEIDLTLWSDRIEIDSGEWVLQGGSAPAAGVAGAAPQSRRQVGAAAAGPRPAGGRGGGLRRRRRRGDRRRAGRLAGLPRRCVRGRRDRRSRMSELLLIAVPGVTVTEAGGLLRVVVVPRLSGGGADLASYGMADWPTRLAASPPRLTVHLKADPVPAGAPATAPLEVEATHAARKDVWDGFFGRIRVDDFGAPAAYADPQVTPTARHAEDIDAAYGEVTRQVGAPAAVEGELGKLRLDAPPPAPDPRAPKPDFAAPDFHRVIALMRQHPAVLRALGLVLEVQVPRATLDSIRRGTVRVTWPSPPATFETSTSPATRFEVLDAVAGDGSDVLRFVPAATSTIAGGMVRLDAVSDTGAGADWLVATFDVDGAAGRLRDAQVAVTDRSRSSAAEPVMPTRRTAGLQLVHRGRQEWFDTKQARSRGDAARLGEELVDGLPVLGADDVALGYRLDVRDEANPDQTWHSVMRREARYEVEGVVIADWHSEEAHLPPAAAVKGTGEELYADGVVARWEGHRLSLPRPTPGGTTASPEVVGSVADRMPYRFTWRHRHDPQEPSPHPQLRLAHGYDLRLRVVDIAGGGLEASDVGGGDRSISATYGRHEPVLPPELPPPPGLLVLPTRAQVQTDAAGNVTTPQARVDQAVLGPGGRLDRLVVRSDPAGDAGPGGLDASGYPANDTRALLPPAATFSMVEWEDRLSDDDLETWRLARRALAAPRASADPKSGRQYTWVPDLAASGVSVTVVPLATRTRGDGPDRSTWPDQGWPDHPAKSLRVRPAAPGTAFDVNWNVADRADVTVPAGARAVVEVASTVAAEYIGRFAASADISGVAEALDAVKTGRHPVVTPARRIEVVHAVRRPLGRPTGRLVADRVAGDLSATVRGDGDGLLGIDRDSTVQVDVSAAWSEWTTAEPTPVTQSVGSLLVDLDAPALPPLVHQFGDTRHRLVTYTLAARSRHREFFDAGDPEAAFVNEATLEPVHVVSTAQPVVPAVLALTPAARQSVETLWPPPPTTGTGEWVDVDGDGIPDPPPYIELPLPPGWVVTRDAGRIRVELAGPWYTTGEGEQLGVVVAPGPGAEAIERDAAVPAGAVPVGVDDPVGATLVSTAHLDPVLLPAQPPQPPQQLDHTTLSGSGGDPLVVLEPGTGLPVVVVPFDVFSVDGRWFADIGFGGLADATYRPMVRLKVVRFQRHSLPGLTSSPVVGCDLVSVLPAREARLEQQSDGAFFTLFGTGPGFAEGTPDATPVEVRLESAPSATPSAGLTALDPAGPGWRVEWTRAIALEARFGPITTPNDGRAYRLVVREIERLPGAERPGTALEAANARQTVFAAVVPV